MHVAASMADFLDLMIVCLQSGHSLQPDPIRQRRVRIAHPEFAGELNIVQRNISLARRWTAGLRRFAERWGATA